MIIRCEYCDMAYDGSKHLNCPHCLAHRPSNGGRGSQGAVLYSDDVPYLRIEVQNGRYNTLMTLNERRERLGLKKLAIPEPYGTVERR